MQRSTVPEVLRSPGRPLATPLRAEREARLGADFADVRVHDDSAAQRSAAEIGAHAYTSGRHVVAGAGGLDMHTLAHELTHVLQQRDGPIAGTDNGAGLSVSDPSDRFERAAEANATRVMARAIPVGAAEERLTPRGHAGGGLAVQRMDQSQAPRQPGQPQPQRFRDFIQGLEDHGFDAAYNAYGQHLQGFGRQIPEGMQEQSRRVWREVHFGEDEVRALAATHSVAGAQDAYAWLAGIPDERLAEQGFRWRQGQVEVVERVFRALREEAGAAEADARRAVEERRRTLDPSDGSTWEMGPVQGDEAQTLAEADRGLYNAVVRGVANANGVGGVRIPASSVNTPYHSHLARGSHGIAFAYLVTADWRVSPFIYDFANSRTPNNEYQWQRGPRRAYNSPLPNDNPLVLESLRHVAEWGNRTAGR